MPPKLLYLLCVVGAVGLYLLVRPGRRPMKAVGVLLGVAGLGGLAGQVVSMAGDAGGQSTLIFVSLFSAVAIASAVRMITHERPVYAALYFVLVVLASAALFLMMLAEFMAFALIIVYAGAILITYMFVLMLAQQASQSNEVAGTAEYDRFAREPAAAVFVGFLMLAVLGDAFFGARASVFDDLPTPAEATAAAWASLDDLPRKREAVVRELVPEMTSIERLPGPDGAPTNRAVQVIDGEAYVNVYVPSKSTLQRVQLPQEALPDNTEAVGLALVAKFPVSLELAGVILLMAMFGAVVLARRQYELGEDERREAAGMARYTPDDHPVGDGGGGA